MKELTRTKVKSEMDAITRKGQQDRKNTALAVVAPIVIAPIVILGAEAATTYLLVEAATVGVAEFNVLLIGGGSVAGGFWGSSPSSNAAELVGYTLRLLHDMNFDAE